ncbi:bacteriocin biosynthesis cyclodehydratase domain-containing protein [Kibdelosporangium banguiense]|uniref:Bacteriocin biosynthesis cyclodehydratase domain-containing protein n=1 Tax=Kibdelosporangium banguiense TaxID=1365924 RepID=A0ABS4T817_9PSEU|nr:ThiF family adenylyltransferase [Kibdelosporangium banguiense]MBP2320557.1 bacteriocin biosynthesis cyclodehydratase domain-containing protein [Kibdelosporangium banguiense]
MSHRGSSLPRRPRLLAGLPVLRRGDDEIQLGLDPRHAVVIEGVTRTVAESVRRLDGQVQARQLLERTPEEERPALAGLLRELHDLGLIDDAARSKVPGRLAADASAWALRTGHRPGQLATARKESSVLVHGSGRLGIAVATLLASAGIGAVEVQADGLVAPEDTGSGYRDEDVGKPRRDIAQSILGNARVSRPDLVVLTDSMVPAPEVVTRLLSDSVPHLGVRAREGIGIVGPFVVPGRSSCLSCADLHRADRDSGWTTVAAQLVGQVQPAGLTCAHATAALAAEQVMRALAWLSGGDSQPPAWNTTMELDPFHGRLDRRSWPPHPHCSCGAH